jgi:hypothetical protein
MESSGQAPLRPFSSGASFGVRACFADFGHLRGRRPTRHAGYAVSQRKRKRIEEPFGWGKTIGGLTRPMLRGVKKLDFKFTLTMAGYNLIRLPKLIAAKWWQSNDRTGLKGRIQLRKTQIAAACYAKPRKKID